MNSTVVSKSSTRRDDGRKLSNKFTSLWAVQQISSMNLSEFSMKPLMDLPAQSQ
jgi:hypothetical protein